MKLNKNIFLVMALIMTLGVSGVHAAPATTDMKTGSSTVAPKEQPKADQKVVAKETTVTKSTTPVTKKEASKKSYNDLLNKIDSLSDDEDDLRKRDIDKMGDKLLIDESYRQSKAIKLPPKRTITKEVSTQKPIMTDREIIRGLLKPQAKDVKIDLDFDEVKLTDILMTLGKAGDLNILLDPDMKNLSMDIHLKQVSVEEALLLLDNAYDLGLVRIENSLFISSKEKLKTQSIVSKVIKVRNIKAEDAKVLLAEIIKTVNVSDEINSIIVVGQPEEIMKVDEVMKTIDVPQNQVVLEARIIEVNKDALKDLGVDWSDSVTLSYQEGHRPLDFSNEEDPNSSPFNIEAFQRSPIQLEMVLKMLENQNKAKVLSNPKVSTLNDKEAEIFVGDRIPYTVTTVSGGVATTDVRFEEPGIRLKITPSIIGDDFVVIKIEPEVSFIFAFRGPNNEFPHTKKRKATAYVRVKDNQPFILGGLLNQEDKKSLSKVPVLGNLPLLGNLFSYENHSVLDTELIITVTPTIVQGEI